MAWLIDNAKTIYLLLGVAALLSLAYFWTTKRLKDLIWLAIVAGIAGILWLLCLMVPTDRQTLEAIVRNMALGVVEGKEEKVFVAVSKDFSFQGMTRDQIRKAFPRAVKEFHITDIRVWDLSIPDVDRIGKQANVEFKVTVTGMAEQLMIARVVTKFVLEPGTPTETWRLKELHLFQPIANADQPIHVPLRP